MISEFISNAYSASNSVGILRTAHTENQDSFVADSKGLFAVADGVGGYDGAKEASTLAIQRLKENSSSLIDESSIEGWVDRIHFEIQVVSRKLGYYGMGTTIALAKLVLPEVSKESTSGRHKLISANVGDSPILLFKKEGKLVPAYHDDSARLSNPRDMWSITQYLGFDGKMKVHSELINYEEEDVLLLCSDGITDNLLRSDYDEEELSNLVLKFRSAKKIVDAAIEAGVKKDDMTAMLVFL